MDVYLNKQMPDGNKNFFKAETNHAKKRTL